MTRATGVLTWCLAVLLSTAVYAQGHGDHAPSTDLSAEAAGHIHLLNELGARRINDG